MLEISYSLPGTWSRYSASVARRQAQLQEMRDKLKERNRKADMARLKKDLLNDSLNLESGFSRENDNFFDD